jgi:hypothetical protein
MFFDDGTGKTIQNNVIPLNEPAVIVVNLFSNLRVWNGFF